MATLYNYISSQEKLQRQYRLTIQAVDENDNPINKAVVIDNINGDTGKEQGLLTMKFQVNRSIFEDVNSMNIEIYNLAPKTYNQLFFDFFNEQRRTIILEAGYKGQVLSTIFIGDVWSCYTERQGCNVITKIEALVGIKSFSKQIDATLWGATRNQILRKAAHDMGMNINIYSGENVKFNRSVSVAGNAYGVIQQYSDGNVYVDNNEINVLENQDAIKGEVVLINDESGLLGVPKHEDAILTVEMIFEPRIVIGQIIEIKSRVMPPFDGQYKVYGIKHEGIISDSVSGSATTTLEMMVGTQVYGRFHVKTKQ